MDYKDITAIRLTRQSSVMLVEITFFGPKLRAAGESAVYSRAEVREWIEKWLNS